MNPTLPFHKRFDIFVSYSSKDRDRAISLIEKLRTFGYSIWIDQGGIDAASRWSADIVDAMSECSTVLLLLSINSLNSINVAKELNLASEWHKTIIPLNIEEVDLTKDFAYHLAGKQRTSIDNIEAICQSLKLLGVHTHSDITHASHFQIEQPTDPKKRIAILPFDDLTPAKDHDWFSDGLCYELISILSEINKLYVIDRQSIQEYRNSKLKTKQIAQELQVRYIVSGTVQKSGNNIRITDTLIDAVDGSTLWNHKFTGVMDDIFEIQEKVVSDIVEGLKLKLTSEEEKKIGEHSTDNAQALELNLRGTSLGRRNTKQDFLESIGLLQKAIDLDPNYPTAYIQMAHSIMNMYRNYDRNPVLLERAETALIRARELNPMAFDLYNKFAFLYMLRQDTDNAIASAKKAVELLPSSPASWFGLAFVYEGTGLHHDSAIAYERTLTLMPNNLIAHYNLILQYEQLEEIEQCRAAAVRALPHFENYLSKHPDELSIKQYYAIALYDSGRKDDCFSILESLVNNPDIDAASIYNAACQYSIDQKRERSLELLDKAVEAGYANRELFINDPEWAWARETSEWKTIIAKLDHTI